MSQCETRVSDFRNPPYNNQVSLPLMIYVTEHSDVADLLVSLGLHQPLRQNGTL